MSHQAHACAQMAFLTNKMQ